MNPIECFRNSTIKKDGKVEHQGDDNYYTKPKGEGKLVEHYVSAGGGKTYITASFPLDEEKTKERGNPILSSEARQWIAEQRVNALVPPIVQDLYARMEQLRKRTNKSSYKWSEAQVEEVFGVLNNQLASVYKDALANARSEKVDNKVKVALSSF